jgi:hypothetical protein
MGQDQFGMGTTLQSAIHLMADLAALGIAACITIVVLGVISVARGRAEPWSKNRD